MADVDRASAGAVLTRCAGHCCHGLASGYRKGAVVAVCTLPRSADLRTTIYALAIKQASTESCCNNCYISQLGRHGNSLGITFPRARGHR
jgi:hypothetical protein